MLKQVVHKVTTGIERIYLWAVGIRRARSITARGNLNTHFHLIPRLRMSGIVMQLFHTPSWLAREQLYVFIK